SWDDTNPEVWRENPHFNYKGGLIPSSLGPSKIRQFCIEGNRAIVILENGAVFAYGDLHLFRSYPNLPIDGFIELTDSNNLKPIFSEDILGDLSGAEGQFGIFGTYQVVKYFRDAQAFLTADGIVIQFNYPEHEKSKNSFTPIDPKFFYGEKVVYINNCHGGENYLAESGRLIITATEYFEMSKLFITKLANPIRKEFLPFNLNELQTLILARKQYFTSLQKDGKILNFRFGDNTARDVTHFITQLAKINPDEPDMKIKNFQYGEQINKEFIQNLVEKEYFVNWCFIGIMDDLNLGKVALEVVYKCEVDRPLHCGCTSLLPLTTVFPQTQHNFEKIKEDRMGQSDQTIEKGADGIRVVDDTNYEEQTQKYRNMQDLSNVND
ncbi:MAG: hypothetical protein EZS28_031468, partial [Streblomastix strix]